MKVSGLFLNSEFEADFPNVDSHPQNTELGRLYRGQKFHSSACNYEQNLERTSNSSQSTRPAGRVLWEELLKEVILHISPF